jgi:bacteriocin-like protein
MLILLLTVVPAAQREMNMAKSDKPSGPSKPSKPAKVVTGKDGSIELSEEELKKVSGGVTIDFSRGNVK